MNLRKFKNMFPGAFQCAGEAAPALEAWTVDTLLDQAAAFLAQNSGNNAAVVQRIQAVRYRLAQANTCATCEEDVSGCVQGCGVVANAGGGFSVCPNKLKQTGRLEAERARAFAQEDLAGSLPISEEGEKKLVPIPTLDRNNAALTASTGRLVHWYAHFMHGCLTAQRRLTLGEPGTSTSWGDLVTCPECRKLLEGVPDGK